MALRRLLLWAWVAAPALWPETRTITILHTNDLHARFLPDGNDRGGFARIAAKLRAERDQCKDCLTLDAGDLVQGSPVSTIFKGVPIYEVANTLGIDVSTLGNHEWDYGWPQQDEFFKTARFDVLNNNVFDPDGKRRAPRGWIIKEVNGMKVLVVGVHMEDLSKLVSPANLRPWKTISPVEGVRKAVEEVGGKADMVIALVHSSPDDGLRILNEVPEVDVVINGHEHGPMEQMARAGNGVMVRNRGYGTEIGRLSIVFDLAEKKIARADWKKIPIDRAVESAPDTAQMVASWEARVAEAIDVEIGEVKHDFDKEGVRRLMERAMCETVGADLAYMNAGGVRDVLKTGVLRKRNLWTIMPFDNMLVAAKFKGSQLPEAITKRYPVDPDREYTVAISDFTAQTEAVQNWKLEFPVVGPLLRDVLIDWFAKKKTIE